MTMSSSGSEGLIGAGRKLGLKIGAGLSLPGKGRRSGMVEFSGVTDSRFPAGPRLSGIVDPLLEGIVEFGLAGIVDPLAGGIVLSPPAGVTLSERLTPGMGNASFSIPRGLVDPGVLVEPPIALERPPGIVEPIFSGLVRDGGRKSPGRSRSSTGTKSSLGSATVGSSGLTGRNVGVTSPPTDLSLFAGAGEYVAVPVEQSPEAQPVPQGEHDETAHGEQPQDDETNPPP